MTIHAAARTARPTRSVGWVPFALVALVLIPAIAGSLRLVELAGGPQLIPANPRLTASPAPLVVHIISALSYAVLGALFTKGIGNALFGSSELTTDLCLGAGWAINLAIAEYVIRRPARRRAITRKAINRRSITATAKVGSS